MTPEEEQRAHFITDHTGELIGAVTAGKHHQLQPHIDAVNHRYGADGVFIMLRLIAESIATGVGLREQLEQLRRQTQQWDLDAEVYASFDMIDSGLEPVDTGDPEQDYRRDARTAAVQFVIAHVNNDTSNLAAMFRAAAQTGTMSMLMDGILQYLRAELVAHGANTDDQQPERPAEKRQIRTFVVADGVMTEIDGPEEMP